MVARRRNQREVFYTSVILKTRLRRCIGWPVTVDVHEQLYLLVLSFINTLLVKCVYPVVSFVVAMKSSGN